MSQTATKVAVSTRIEPALADRLKARAKANSRSIAAETQIAIAAHLGPDTPSQAQDDAA